MSLQYSSPTPPVVYSSPAVPLTSTDGYFGENGVYYDPEGITEVDIGSTASPAPKRKRLMPPINNPALRLMWLLVSSMVAVQEGNCQFCPTHNGLYPNVGNCKCYYKCIDGVPIQKSCPPGKKFDVMSMSCTYPTNTVCAGSLLQMLPAIMNSQGGNMMQQMQQMQQQQMQYQPMQQQQMQQMPQGQMPGGTNGKFHITVAIQKPNFLGGGGGNGGNGGGGNGGNGGGGNGGNGGSMMQMMKMLMMMMQNQQQGTDQSMNQQNMMGQNMMNQNMMGQNMMNQNMMSQYMGKQNMYQNMMNQNMMGQGMGQQNMMGQGMGQQNMMGQGMGGGMGQQNMMQQNMMNQNMMQGGNGGGGGGGGMGMGGNQQCVTCNRPKKEVTITYNLDLKRLPLRFRLFG